MNLKIKVETVKIGRVLLITMFHFVLSGGGGRV